MTTFIRVITFKHMEQASDFFLPFFFFFTTLHIVYIAHYKIIQYRICYLKRQLFLDSYIFTDNLNISIFTRATTAVYTGNRILKIYSSKIIIRK
jgi:hypothetical protein